MLGLLIGVMLAGCEFLEQPPGPPAEPGGGSGPAPPEILSLSRSQGAVHTRVEIYGRGFGEEQGTSFVRFGSVRAPVLSWSEGAIVVRVPLIPTPKGKPREAPITVVVDRRVSNAMPFRVVRGIVYSSRRDPPGLYIMNPDGSEPTPLLKAAGYWPPALWESEPSWSPDGTRIAFASYDQALLQATGGCRAPTLSAFYCTEIFIVEADGGVLMRVTHNAYADRHPTWSPDGTHLIFSSDRTQDDHERNAQLFRIRVDGTGEEQLTFNNVSNEDPDWSPDGRRVAFTYDPPGGIPGLSMKVALLDLESGEIATLGPGSRPAWAPDGERIAFRCNTSICVLAPDEEAATPLTAVEGVNDDQPTWSPEGDRIVFVRQRLPSERFEIWGVRTDRGSPYLITNRPTCPREPPTCELGPDWY